MNTRDLRNCSAALAIAASLAVGVSGCAGGLDGFLTDAGKIVSFVDEPSTQAAIAAVEKGGQQFVCAAASAQSAATAAEAQNGAGKSIVTDGQYFYFGSSIACALLGGSVTQVATASATPVAAAKAVHTVRGLRYYVAKR